MSKPLVKLTKNIHLDNLLSKLPLITFLYATQCLFMHWMLKEVSIGNYAISLGAALITFIVSMYVYHKYHHVILCEEHIQLYFQLTNSSKYIKYSQIEKIVIPVTHLEYGAIQVIQKDKKSIVLHFIDYPDHVKKFIEDLAQTSEPISEEDSAA